MGVLLGQTPQPNAPADQLTTMLARKTRSELYDYLSQMQSLLHQNPTQARQVLLDNPQLARALFHMEIILGMVSNPLGDIAPKGTAPSGILPPRHFDGPPPGMDQPPPSYAQQPPPHNGMPPQYHQPHQYPPHQQGAMPASGPPPIDPRVAQLPAAAAPVDPRLQAMGGAMPQHPAPMAAGPRPMVSAAVGGQPPAVAAAPAVPGMSPDQQQGTNLNCYSLIFFRAMAAFQF